MRIKTFVSSLLSAAIALVAVELFLRLLIPWPIFYSTWYEAGIHQPDKELGYVLTPNYRGAMRHRDKAWYVPLELDPNGCRFAVSTLQDHQGTDVVLMGGRSMAFCFGLESSQTIAAQLAKHSPMPTTVHTLSWPGFDLNRELVKYERLIEPNIKPKLVIVFLYKLEDYADVCSPVQLASAETASEDLFRFYDSIVAPPPGRLADWIGHPACQSYLLHALCREINRIDEVATRRTRVRASNSNRQDGEARPALDVSHAKGMEEPTFLDHLRERVASHDARLLVVALPHRTKFVGPVDLDSVVPQGVPALDLRNCLKHVDADWKADNHYGAHSTELIGSQISQWIQLLDLEPTEENVRVDN